MARSAFPRPLGIWPVMSPNLSIMWPNFLRMASCSLRPSVERSICFWFHWSRSFWARRWVSSRSFCWRWTRLRRPSWLAGLGEILPIAARPGRALLVNSPAIAEALSSIDERHQGIPSATVPAPGQSCVACLDCLAIGHWGLGEQSGHAAEARA